MRRLERHRRRRKSAGRGNGLSKVTLIAPVFEEPVYLSAHVLVIEVRLFGHKEFPIDDFVASPIVGEALEIS